MYGCGESASSKQIQDIYSTIKKITGKPTVRMQSVKSKDGNIFTENDEDKNRWKENYQQFIYNIQNPVNDTMVDTIP